MDKRAAKQAYKAQQLAEFKQSLPIKETEFNPLFDFIDAGLEKDGCQHNFALLEKYCENKPFDTQALKAWLNAHGAYCDCEIIANVEELFYYLEKPACRPPVVKKQQPPLRQKLDRLVTDFGFSIEKIPQPWVLYAVNKGKGEISYQFQIGKKADFCTLLEPGFPVEKLSDQHFLQSYWDSVTDLTYNNEIAVEQQTISSFGITIVKTNAWTPAFVFAHHANMGDCCLIMKTETARLRTDLKELEKLLNSIAIANT